MTKPSTNIDEDRAIGIPVFSLSTDRIHGEPGRHSLSLLHHVLLKWCKSCWILLKPNKGWYVDIKGRLENTFCVISDSLIFGSGQELGQLLEDWPTVVEARVVPD